jgi:hypothetical protein
MQLENSGSAALTGNLALKTGDFVHPREVLAEQDLDPMEKRAILAAWASDACAVESRPEFRWLPGTPGPVALTHILATLRALDVEMERQSAMIAAMAPAPFSQRAPY